MIVTLAWKEIREHQGIWLTMVIMSVVLGIGLAKIVAIDDGAGHLALAVASLTIIGMASTYGVVCGAMMLAGEHESGTLTFLDIFLGRRGLLWAGKLSIGILLVLAQSLTVAGLLVWLEQQAPSWARAFIGYSAPMRGGVPEAPTVWFVVLPVVTLEAFFWGLLGSSLSRLVLRGAAIAAVCFTIIIMIALCTPPEVFVAFRLAAVCICLVSSYALFVQQSREIVAGPRRLSRAPDRKEQFLTHWDEIEPAGNVHRNGPVLVPASQESETPPAWVDAPAKHEQPLLLRESYADEAEQAKSPWEVLWWLTLNQAKPILWTVGAAGLLAGLLLFPGNVQALWPLATLFIGVACGTAVFAPEQRDLSYHFLAAQHFPLGQIWRFKIVFWLSAAIAGALLAALGTALVGVAYSVLDPQQPGAWADLRGTLYRLLGPFAFFAVWLAYGFCIGQFVVWLCRKSILALLLSFLISAGALALWMPSLLCGGMSTWPVWGTPVAMMLATGYLMRAWASGRIWERKPLAGWVGFIAGAVLWAAIVFTYRAVEVPDVGPPLDPVAFKEGLETVNDHSAARWIHKALAEYENRDPLWQESLATASTLPLGVLEPPRSTGALPLLGHLAGCEMMAIELRVLGQTKPADQGLEHVAQALALSRNMRNKAPLEAYLAGIKTEEEALEGLKRWRRNAKPSQALLRLALQLLERHIDETPPPLDCLQTECYRCGGVLDNPNIWSFANRGARERIPERWLANTIAVSLETPWEGRRKTRIWRLVWAGIFRAIQVPHWEVPTEQDEPRGEKTATRNLLRGWLPPADGPGADFTRDEAVRLLDPSWLADERLFSPVVVLRKAANRAHWRLDAARLIVALHLYQADHGKMPQELHEISCYFPSGIPVDPYSGEPYRYRIEGNGARAILWSTGPDRVDHHGKSDGGHLPDDDPQWTNGDFDLILTTS